MAYHLDFTDKAKVDINAYTKSGNKVILNKLLSIFEELAEHPYSGIGKPEQLKHHLTGCWLRRINREHRLIYEVVDQVILILSARGHYD